MAATIKDIARETGLSLATISKYLNGGNLREKNRAAIEAAIKKLVPSTLEGCVVRVCDMIAYLGKDRQDAMTAHLIQNRERILKMMEEN